jgi:glycosyltransferase involved in cell wall biosynthesis
MSPKIQVLYRDTGSYDAIARHGRLLVESLQALGFDASYDGGGVRWLPPSGPGAGSWLLIQYNAYSYGRWGFAPKLIAYPWIAKRRRRGLRIALFVHEWADDSGQEKLKRRVLLRWQRFQLGQMVRRADVVLVSTAEWSRKLGPFGSVPECWHIPIGSNIQPAKLSDGAARAALGIPADSLVIGLFGGGHRSRAIGHVDRAIDLIGSRVKDVVVLNLGHGAPSLAERPGVEIRTTGALSEYLLSTHLSCCDIYLAPFLDGVSTRRTTVAAALAHGLPVVGTSTEATDDLFSDSPEAICLVDLDEVGQFAQQALALAVTPSRRATLSVAGEELYRKHLSAGATARRVAEALRLCETDQTA